MNLFSRFLPASVAVFAIRVALDTDPENRRELVSNERIQPTPQHPDSYMVETPSGTSIAGPGDWIVKDEKGNLSVWDNENFRATYYSEEAATAPLRERAEAAYARYGEVTHRKNYAGEPMPAFADLPEKIQRAWEAVVSWDAPAKPAA